MAEQPQDNDYPDVDTALRVLVRKLEHEIEHEREKSSENGGIYVPKYIAAGLFVTLLGLAVSALLAFSDMNTRLSIIEGNRFTSGDALLMRREIESGPPTAQAIDRFQRNESRIQRLEGYHLSSPQGVNR